MCFSTESCYKGPGEQSLCNMGKLGRQTIFHVQVDRPSGPEWTHVGAQVLQIGQGSILM
jgi:hypothetical protein